MARAAVFVLGLLLVSAAVAVPLQTGSAEVAFLQEGTEAGAQPELNVGNNGHDVVLRGSHSLTPKTDYIDKNLRFSMDGVLTKWSFFCKGNGYLHLQVWRRATSHDFRDYELVGENIVTAKDGYNLVPVVPSQQIAFQAGDVVGWRQGDPDHTGASALLVFDEGAGGDVWANGAPLPCKCGEHKRFDEALPQRTYSISGTFRYFPDVKIKGLVMDRDLRKLGHNIVGRKGADAEDLTRISFVDTSLKFDSPGVVEAWFKHGGREGTITFQVWRQVHNDEFLLVGENMFVTHQSVELFEVPRGDRIAFQVGDMIGWRYESEPGLLSFDEIEETLGQPNVRWTAPDTDRPLVGKIAFFPESHSDSRSYSIQAFYRDAAGVVNAFHSRCKVDTDTIAGHDVTFTITSHDMLDRPQVKGGKPWLVRVSKDDDPQFKQWGRVIDVGDGTYVASFTLYKTGQYHVGVSVYDEPAEGSPFALTVHPAPPSLRTTYCTGPRVHDIVQDHWSVFQIVVRDEFDNLSPIDPARLSLLVRSRTGSHWGAQIVEGGTSFAVYDAAYVVDRTGTFNMTVLMNDQPLEESPYTLQVRPDVTDPSKSFLLSKQRIVIAGELTTYKVQAVNFTDTPRIRGLDRVTLSLVGPENLEATTVDHHDGTYSLSWTATVTGVYNATVLVNSEGIVDGVFSVRVDPAALDVASCVVEAPSHLVLTAGVPHNITVLPRDRFHNLRPVEASTFDAVVTRMDTDRQVDNVTQFVLPDSRVQLTFFPVKATRHKFEVILAKTEERLPEGPLTLTVEPGSLSVKDSVAFGWGLTTSVAGYPASFSVEQRDHWGNNITAAAYEYLDRPWSRFGEVWDVVLYGPDKFNRTLQLGDKKNGFYNGVYTVTRTGVYHLHISMHGVALSGSPFAIHVHPADASVTTSIIVGQGAHHAIQDIPSTFTIQARDAYNNIIERCCSDYSFQLVRDHELVTHSQARWVGTAHGVDGLYEVSYVASSVGTYQAHVLLRGEPLKGSPFDVEVVPDVTHPEHSEATFEDHVSAGTGATVGIRSFNKTSEPRLRGGDDWVVVLSNPNVEDPVTADLTNFKNGTYTATYVPFRAGEYTMTIRLDGREIQGGPFTVTVGPGPTSPEQSSVRTPVVDPVDGQVEAGTLAEFVIKAKDAYGNDRLQGGDTFEASVLRPDGEALTDVAPVDEGDGTFYVRFVPSQAGEYSIKLALDGTPLSGSPFSLSVKAAALDLQNTELVGTCAHTAFEDKPCKLLMRARDHLGNVRAVRPARWLVSVAVEQGESASDNCPTTIVPATEDNTEFTVTYTCSSLGTASAHIGLAGSDEEFVQEIQVKAVLTDPTRTLLRPASSETLAMVTKGSTKTFTIEARDTEGEKRTRGGDTFTVDLDGINGVSEHVSGNVIDMEDGTYMVMFAVNHVGQYTCSVRLVREGIPTPVRDTPFTVTSNPEEEEEEEEQEPPKPPEPTPQPI